MASILIVDDQPHVRKLVSKSLSAEGYQIEATGNPALIWEHIRERQSDLVLLNSLSDRLDSFELLIDIKRGYPKFPVLVYVIKSVDAVERLKEAITGVLDE